MLWRSLRRLWRIPFFTVHVLLLVWPVIAVIKLRPARASAAISWWSGHLLGFLGLKVNQHGQPADCVSLWIANHVSWVDIEVLHSIEAVAFIGKAEIRSWPLLGYMAATGGTIFHQRGSRESLRRVSDRMAAVMRDGRSGAIFPEGKTTDGTEVRKFHARLFQTALDAKVPIQPVALKFTTMDGALNPEIPFINDETLVANLWRMLGAPASQVHVVFAQPIPILEQTRTNLARQAQQAVETAWQNI